MPSSPPAGPLAVAGKTLGVLALLTAVLPLDLALTGAALLRGAVVRPAETVAAQPKTVLVSGGKMTKALQLCRSLHQAGHRVVLVETAKYRLTGHRFSRSVAAFHVVPSPQDPGYAAALLDIVRREGVDVYVPVCSPVASYYDALAAQTLAPYCEVLHADAETVARLDDKEQFSALARSLGLAVPESYRITAPEQVLDLDFAAHPGPFILKSIPYDPVHRLDLTRVPCATPAETEAFVRSRDITPETPWILQAFVPGQEFCTHSTVRDGVVQVYACCKSSAFQINYAMADEPAIRDWVERFVGGLGLTGQVSFDFIKSADGTVAAIECNPRTHSAITMFGGHPDLARAYLDSGVETITPLAGSRPTYWIYHEVWRLLTQPERAARLRTILAGRDAIFDWSDPLPFLLVHHLQIPSLLWGNLRRGKDWMRVDLNIGKLVEPAGD